MNGCQMILQDERESLRIERQRLDHEHAALAATAETLRGSTDLTALQMHSEGLRQHQAALHAYTLRLHAFHERFGPLGD
jgi:hypothetical protein